MNLVDYYIMHCGKRLKKLIKDSGLLKNEFAAKIDTPPTTLSGWFNLYDVKLANIRKCCEVLGIDLWEFFLEDKSILKDYISIKYPPDYIDLMDKLFTLDPAKRKKMVSVFSDIFDLAC